MRFEKKKKKSHKRSHTTHHTPHLLKKNKQEAKQNSVFLRGPEFRLSHRVLGNKEKASG
jgi:hypothetical protein